MGRYVSYAEEIRALREHDWIDSDALRAAISVQLEHPVYAVCQLSPTRFFWAVWSSVRGMHEESLVGSDYAQTREAAEQRARETAGLLASFPPLPRYERLGGRTLCPIRQYTLDSYHRRMAAGFAAHIHHQRAVQRRMERPPSEGSESAAREFVYQFHTPDQGEDYLIAYRVVKKTKTRVYVEREPRPGLYKALAEDPDDWRLHDIPTFVLDRVKLESEGQAYSRDHGTFYLRPERPHYQRQTPPCFATLGLRFPCTAADLRRMWRRVCKEKHPDVGGNAAQFILLKDAYEEAKSIVMKSEPEQPFAAA